MLTEIWSNIIEILFMCFNKISCQPKSGSRLLKHSNNIMNLFNIMNIIETLKYYLSLLRNFFVNLNIIKYNLYFM